MLSRMYFMKTRKIVALLVSALFLLGMFPGCTESPEAPTRQLQSVERRPVADDDAESGDVAVPLTETEKATLIAEALSLPEGQSVLDSLNDRGYDLRANLAVGAKKVVQPYLGAQVIVIPFGIAEDSAKAAFINYAKWETQSSLGVFFTVSQVDSPTTGPYERIAPGLWLQVDISTSEAFSPSSISAGQAFAHCYGKCTASISVGCLVTCLLLGPGYFACIAACMAGAGYGCLIECLF